MSKRHFRSARVRRRGGALAITAVAMFMALAVGAAGAQASAFTITKTTDPAGDPQPFTYHVTFAPHPGDTPPADPAPDDFTLTGGQSRTFTVHKGFYTVTELSVSGWRLAAITCDDGGDTDPADKAKIDLAGRKATIELSSTEKKACMFRNVKAAPLVPPSSTPPSTPSSTPPSTPPSTPSSTPPSAGAAPEQTTAPAQEVRGVQAVRSAARLAAPTRCVSRRFTVSVNAARVASVTFFVNGRRLRTLAARPGQRRFSVQVRRPVATARIVAQVRFRRNTTPATRTLRATIRRCAQQQVRPEFTG